MQGEAGCNEPRRAVTCRAERGSDIQMQQCARRKYEIPYILSSTVIRPAIRPSSNAFQPSPKDQVVRECTTKDVARHLFVARDIREWTYLSTGTYIPCRLSLVHDAAEYLDGKGTLTVMMVICELTA